MTNQEIGNAISAMAAKLLQESREYARNLAWYGEEELDEDEYNYEPDRFGWPLDPS
jgi:hypothetical protein